MLRNLRGRPLYRVHGWLTRRKFERTPPRLSRPEGVALWLVRGALDALHTLHFASSPLGEEGSDEMGRYEGQSPNCSHKPDPCPSGCGCYCNGCTIERLVGERDALLDERSELRVILGSLDAAMPNDAPDPVRQRVQSAWTIVSGEVREKAMATEEDVEDGPWRAGAIGRIPDDDALVWRDDAVYGAQFYAATPTEAEGAARLSNDLEARTTRYRTALEKLRDLMNPKNREQFVMRGPMAFVSVYNVVEDALK